LKVVHVSTSDNRGGAAIAAHRLHRALLKEGIDSEMLVMEKESDEKEVLIARDNNIDKYIFSKVRILFKKIILAKYKKRKNIIFSPAKFGIDITKNNVIKEADVIHLHWIVGGFLSLNSLEKIFSLDKKIVWTLHDSWAFTGGCHVRYNCEKYKKECKECPMLNSNTKKDLSNKVFNKKNKIFSKVDKLDIITPSSWLNKCVSKSLLLGKFQNHKIPNVLDENIFKTIDKKTSRDILNLEQNKKYICFGALNSTTTEYKGWKYLKKALYLLDDMGINSKNNIELLVFGSSYSKSVASLPFDVTFLGRLYDEHSLSLVYNAVDVFVGPSLEEAFGQTFNESIFVGTPAISFENTGTEDIIDHKVNGYLARYKDSEDLANGIIWTLNNLENVDIKEDSLKTDRIINEILDIYKN
jgi:glycosyltransferase involved in cell wall biosynthesis